MPAARDRTPIRQTALVSALAGATIISVGLAFTVCATNASAASKPSVSQASRANPYAFGFGTWYVATRRNVPSNWGDAKWWYHNAQISGFKVGSVPVPGSIAWTGGGFYGQVAYVERVSADGSLVTISEMDYDGAWDRVTDRTVIASSLLYIY